VILRNGAILPLVRLLATEEHLEAMEPMVRQVQYVGLYCLACRMTARTCGSRSANTRRSSRHLRSMSMT
jgi:hypothetical protein